MGSWHFLGAPFNEFALFMSDPLCIHKFYDKKCNRSKCSLRATLRCGIWESNGYQYYFHADGIRCRPRLYSPKLYKTKAEKKKDVDNEKKILESLVATNVPVRLPTYKSTKYWYAYLSNDVPPEQCKLAGLLLTTYVRAKITYEGLELKTTPVTSSETRSYLTDYQHYVMGEAKLSKSFEGYVNPHYPYSKVNPPKPLDKCEERDMLVLGTDKLLQEHIWHRLISYQNILKRDGSFGDLQTFVNKLIVKPSKEPEQSKDDLYYMCVGGGIDDRNPNSINGEVEWNTLKKELEEELELKCPEDHFLLQVTNWKRQPTVDEGDGFRKTAEYSFELTKDQYEKLNEHCLSLSTTANTLFRPTFLTIE